MTVTSIDGAIDLTSAHVLENPYPVYRQLREHAPVSWHSGFGAWLLTRYEDVVGMLSHPAFSAARLPVLLQALPKSAAAAAGPFLETTAGSLFFLDPPEHASIARAMHELLTARAIARMHEEIRGIVEHVTEPVLRRRSFDAVEDIGSHIGTTVVASMLSLRDDEARKILEWADGPARLFGGDAPSIEDAMRASSSSLEMLGFVGEVVADARRARTPVVARLLELEEEGALTRREVCLILIDLLVAGQLPLRNLIGNTLHALLHHPHAVELLLRDRSLIGSAVDEVLRYDAPNQLTNRVTVEDVQVRGTTIPRGSLVYAMLGAANRDPAVFPDPDRFDVARAPNRHLGFGAGAHRCPGSSLARTETSMLIELMLPHLTAMRVASATRRPSLRVRGFSSLCIEYDDRDPRP